jgi:hypothetical protein
VGFQNSSVVQTCPESDVSFEQARVEGNARWEGDGKGDGGADAEEGHQGALMLMPGGSAAEAKRMSRFLAFAFISV